MTITNKRSLIAFLLTVVLVVSLFTLSVSATDVDSTSSTSETTAATEETTASDETTDSGETTKSSETTEKEEGTTKKEEKTDKEEESTESEAIKNAKKATKKALIINGIIIGAIIVIGVALIIKFREKLGAFMRSVKSELKKIVWSSKTQTRKSFLVVVVVAIAVALLLFIVNTAFTNGISMLADLF